MKALWRRNNKKDTAIGVKIGVGVRKRENNTKQKTL